MTFLTLDEYINQNVQCKISWSSMHCEKFTSKIKNTSNIKKNENETVLSLSWIFSGHVTKQEHSI
jgi:hypothetical protein